MDKTSLFIVPNKKSRRFAYCFRRLSLICNGNGWRYLSVSILDYLDLYPKMFHIS